MLKVLLDTADSNVMVGAEDDKRLKVAVLDTGVDLTHLDIKGQIFEHACFVHGNTIDDKSGHGTHIAGIILDLTVNVDLYIAKVIESKVSQDRSPLVRVGYQANSTYY
jgi:subtilisin family serine protease